MSNIQFATAWVDKKSGRQILVFAWYSHDEGLWLVQHMSLSEDNRAAYHLKFADNEKALGSERAWAYFETVRSNQEGRREQIEKSFQEAMK